jgi:hypothetical protein
MKSFNHFIDVRAKGRLAVASSQGLGQGSKEPTRAVPVSPLYQTFDGTTSAKATLGLFMINQRFDDNALRRFL